MTRTKKDKIEEDAPTNSAGSGAVAGIGTGTQSEPPGPKAILTKIMRRRRALFKSENTTINEDTFSGNKVFVVPPEYFHRCKMGKTQYDRYEKYVGNDELGETIRQYGRDRKNRKKPIIVQDEATGAMMYLRYGGNHKRK